MKNNIIKITALILFLFSCLGIVFAGNVTFFGPQQYTRDKGKPITETASFNCAVPGAGFTLRLTNGDAQGNNRVSSAVIKINGIEVISPSDFNQQVGYIERTITLNPENEISVKLNSKPGGFVIIDIFKFIPEPEVTFTANPSTIQFQQSSTLTWQVTNADTISIDNNIGNVAASGSIEVSPLVPDTTYTLTAGNIGGSSSAQVTVTVTFPVPTASIGVSPQVIGAGGEAVLTWTTFAAHTVTIEPGIGAVESSGVLTVTPAAGTTYTITALGYGGSKTASATVTIDGTPPQITVSELGDGVYVNKKNVLLKGQVEDISAVILKVNGADVTLQQGNYFEVPLQLVEGSNTVTLSAQDAAGNSSSLGITIFVDSIVPTLEITTPQNNLVTNKDKITVTGGITDANPFKITSGSMEGEIIGNNFYFRDMALQEGENSFEFVVLDRAGNSGGHRITVFRDSAAPQLTLLSPASGALLSKRSVPVKGTVADDHLKEVRINNFLCPVENNAFNLLLTLVEGGNTIHVTAVDTAGNSNSQTLAVEVDTTAPHINITGPLNNVILNTSSLTVSGRVDDSHVSSVKVNGQAAVLNGNQFSFSNVTLQEGENTITVEAEDAAGNTANSTVHVTLDSEAPSIINVIPADQITRVPLSTEIHVELSESVNEATLNEQTFYLETGGQKINGIITPADKKVVFKPANMLPDGCRIYIHLTSGIKDKAGNNLKNPYSGSFFTRDITPPNAPALESVPEQTALSKITLAGSAEAGSEISVSGGSSVVTGTCDNQGKFSIDVPLKIDALNQVCLTAKDEAGNISIPSCVSIYREGGEFSVKDAQFENNELTITFSRPINPSTLTAANFAVLSSSGLQSGAITTNAENTQGTFTPTVDLSGQPVMVEIKTGIKDAEGIALSYPFSKMFNQGAAGGEMIALGEVYDDQTGLPLAGALVQLTSVNGTAPAQPVPSAITTNEGKYVLIIPAGTCVLEIGKEGWTSCHRKVLGTAGSGFPVFDTRLTPLNPEAKNLAPAGGAVSSQGCLIAYPAGTVAVETAINLTAVGPQGLAGRLPSGWSPLAAFNIKMEIAGGELLKPCLLRITNRWTDAGVSSSSLTLVQWDETMFQWKAVSAVSVSPQDIGGTIEKTGQYAFLIKDTAPTVPPAPVIGQPIAGVAQGTIPTEINANLAFNPQTIYPGETSKAVLTISSTTSAPISSGVPVQAKINENYQLLTGAAATFVPYTADLIAYNFGTTTSKVEFNLSPNSKITLAELKIGTIKSGMVRYSTGDTGTIIGPDGGTVNGEGGAQVVIEPDSVKNPIAVTVKKIEETAAPAAPPNGFEAVGIIDLSLGGAKLLKPAALSLSLTQDELNNIPHDAQLFVVKLEKVDYQLSWILVSQGNVSLQDQRISSFKDGTINLPFAGVTEGGTFMFLRALSPVGFITGAVSEASQPFSGALVSVSNHEIKSSSSISASNYVQVGFLGAVELTAKNLTSRDQGSGTGNLQQTGEIITLNLDILKTGPQIVGITPADNAESVPLNSKITFIFSEPVKASTFNDQTIYITAGTEKVAGVFSLSSSGSQGEFTPHQEFASAGTVHITISTGLQDLYGTGMASVFTSSFKTLDIVPPEADLSKITVQMPEGGSSTVSGGPGSVEPGASVIVFNERTGKAVTVTGLSDGSFSTTIEAEITDTLTVRVVDNAGNETVLDSKPFVSADGKRVVLGTQAAEFVSSEGLGIKIQENTFPGPVNVGIYKIDITNPQALAQLAPMPQDFERLNALTLDFGGVPANKPVDISVPAPAGISDSSNIFIAREIEVFGQKKLMIIDATVIKNNRIYSACEPFEDYFRQLDGTISVVRTLFDSAPAFISGTAAGSNTVVLAGEIAYIPQNFYFVFPVPVNRDVQLTVKDLVTGETLYEKTTPGPTQVGQVYNFQKIINTNDNLPPVIIKSTGLLTFAFDVTAQTIENRGIKITPVLNVNNEGQITSIKISGDAGTAAASVGVGSPKANIRVYKLQKKENSDKYEYKEISSFEAENDGSFSKEGIEVTRGDRLFVAVEQGGVALNTEFILSFSEPLDTAYENDDANIPISIVDQTDASSPEVKIRTQLLPSGTEVSVQLENLLKENHVYVLRTRDENNNELSDRNGNKLNIECNFRAKRSESIYAETGANEVYDTVLVGSTLFVASGFGGLRILDVSNPGAIKTITNYTNFAGKVRGLAKYKKDETSPWKLLVVGGGSSCQGFIKLFNISDPKNPVQEKSQIISDNISDTAALPQGHPRHVRVLGNYAFVNVYGAGLCVVDIEGMTVQSDQNNRNAIIRYHYEDFINDAAAFKRMVKDPENPEGPGKEQYVAVILIDYYGIKLLDLNRKADEVTTNPYTKYNMLEIGNYRLSDRKHVMGLVLAEDYWVDIDADGRKGNEEDNDRQQDEEVGDNITAEDETRDMIFFAVPALSRIVMIDITEPSTGMTPYGMLTVEDAQGNYAGNIGEMKLSTRDRVLYVTDTQMGVILLDVNLSGRYFGSEVQQERFLGTIKTSGPSHFGLTIDEDLNTAYVGQENKGVDVVKLGNPEIKFVYKDAAGNFHEVVKISPSGVKTADNPQGFPHEVYVLALLPGGAGAEVKADVWSLNSAGDYTIPWGSKVKTCIKNLPLTRRSSDKTSEDYHVYLSEPITVTIKPNETEGDKKILSGDWLAVYLSKDITQVLTYITETDCRSIFDKKMSVRADLVDRTDNFEEGKEEKPNSPANNPSIYSNVILHSGEFVFDDIDLQIPGRGFDFVFSRTYRSQAIYSSVLGWGWDHNYNKRLLELPGGEIIYFDGSGRRERFKAIKNGDVISSYEPPKGWFVELIKKEDGFFYLIYPDHTIEFFDSTGRLLKIQDRNHNKMEFYYNISGQLAAVMDTMGRMINFEYYPFEKETDENGVPEGRFRFTSGRLKKITDFDGRTIEFKYYEDSGDLKEVDFMGRVKEYVYVNSDSEDIKLAHNLEKIIDPIGADSNSPVLTITYDGNDRVDKQRFIEMNADIDFTIGSASATVTDAKGHSKVFNFTGNTHREVTNGGYTTKYDFNDDGLLTQIEFPEGNKIIYTYDTSNKNRRSQGNLVDVTSTGNDGTITFSYGYENYFNQITSITDAKQNSTSINRDGNGNIDEVIAPGIPAYDYDFNTYGQLEKVTDPMGSITEYTYYHESAPSGDGNRTISAKVLDDTTGGYLEKVILDKGGDSISQNFVYNSIGNITSAVDGEGVTTIYGYEDENGNSNPFGEVQTLTQGATGSNDGQLAVKLVTTFTYDKNGNVKERISRGVTTTYTYDRLNRPRFVKHNGGSGEEQILQEYEYVYDNNSNLTDIIYPKGNRNTFTYNDRDLLFEKIYGNEMTTETYTYTPNGYLHILTDGENKNYTYVHDSHGRLKDIIDPLGNKVSMGYDANSNVTGVDGIGIDGKTFNQGFDFDQLNRLTRHRIRKAVGFITTQYGYNHAGYLQSVTTPNNHPWGITPTGSGLTDIITDPLSNKDDCGYDKRGWLNQLNEIEAGGRSLLRTFTNTVLGNPDLTGDSIGRDYKHIYYQDNQQLKYIRDPEKGLVSFDYDGLNRLRTETRHINYQGIIKKSGTTYKYDANGNLEQIIDSEGNVTRYVYDNKDRLTDIFYPGMTISEHITYNGRDQVLNNTDLNGTLVVNTYDDAGRLTDKTITPALGIEGSSYEHFEYDGLNRLTLASNSDSEVSFIYDKAGLLDHEIQKIKETEAGVETIVATYEVGYEYDDNGNKTQVAYPSGKVITITPDALDRIDHIKENNKLLVDYTYEGKGKIVEKNLQDIIAIGGIFDNGRRPVSLSYNYKDNSGNGEEISFLSRGMDWSLTDLKKHDIESGKKEEYTYDSAYRLRQVNDVKNNTGYEYEIDEVEDVNRFTVSKNGIPESKVTVCNNRHQLVQYNGMDLTYDNNGNLTHFAHDYVYNWKNQLVKVTTGTGVNVEYKYDALGRRIVKKVKDPTSETVTRYVHDGYQVIEERDGNDQVLYRYTYGNGIDERIQMEKGVKKQDGTYEWRSYLPVHDSIGNVIGLSNSKGHLIERYNYTPLGEVTYYNSEITPEVDNILIENGKIKIRFNRPVDLNDIFINLYITTTQSPITGPKIILNMDRDIEFTPSQLPQNESLTITIDAIDELSGSSTSPIQLLSKEFIYQGETYLPVHDQGPPRVERILYENSSNSLYIEFNEDIDPASVTDSVEIEYGSSTIGGSIEITGDNRIKFTPDDNLTQDVDYLIRVKDIKDAASKTIEVFSYNFEFNQQESLIFNLSILAKNNRSIVGNNSLMHGRTYEPEVGLYFYRNRYYHPELGRFLQQDPMGYEDSMNLYQAFGMNPVNFVDPFGLYKYEPSEKKQEWHEDKAAIRAWGMANIEQNPAGRAVMAFTRNAAMGIGIAIIAVKSAPVAIALGSYLLIKGTGDSLNARLDAGQTWEESKRGTIVDFATLGGYTPITGWDAGTGDAVQVTPEHWGNFTGNVVGIVSGMRVYKAMNTPIETSIIRVNLLKPKFSGKLFDIRKTPNGIIIVSESSGLTTPFLESFFGKVIDMAEAPNSSALTALGFKRNAPWFWRQMLKYFPEMFSPKNKRFIKQGKSPIIDETWIEFNKTHQMFPDNKLIHHHIYQGNYATPLPEKMHLDFYNLLHQQKRGGN